MCFLAARPTKKKPEPDVPESHRMWASASFVGVLIVIGLPLWWKTTEVYRVALPYEKIGAFNSSSHVVTTELTVLANDDPTANEIASFIEMAFEKSDVLKLKINRAVLTDDLHNSLRTAADDLDALEAVAEAYDLSQPNHLYLVQRSAIRHDVWVSKERAVFFRDGKASQTVTSVLDTWLHQAAVLRGAKSERSADAARRTRFPPSPALHVVLSVVHPRPDHTGLELHAGDAMEDYIGTFVDDLALLHNFTLKSQWLHLLEFDFQAKQVKDSSEWGRHFAVRQDRLPLLLTKLEERAATRASHLPAINLVIYAQPCSGAPLQLYDSSDRPILSPVQAFMSPKWGGVFLSNPTRGECENGALHRPNVRVAMGALLAHLRPLLGIVDCEPIEGAHLDPLRSVKPRKWEVDNLLRIRTLEQLTSAELTLQSLAQLLGEISNIVINDEVGASITSAVADIERAADLLARGHLAEAYGASLAACTAAEAAFTDPSLLALLYFPDDQKYAIYIPLFLPVMFPVILSIKNLVLWLRGRSVKEKTD